MNRATVTAAILVLAMICGTVGGHVPTAYVVASYQSGSLVPAHIVPVLVGSTCSTAVYRNGTVVGKTLVRENLSDEQLAAASPAGGPRLINAPADWQYQGAACINARLGDAQIESHLRSGVLVTDSMIVEQENFICIPMGIVDHPDMLVALQNGQLVTDIYATCADMSVSPVDSSTRLVFPPSCSLNVKLLLRSPAELVSDEYLTGGTTELSADFQALVEATVQKIFLQQKVMVRNV